MNTASAFARLTLGHLRREWPHRLDQVLNGPEDIALPSTLHPIFHGSYDWHSCVHGWWQVMRIARLHPHLPEAHAASTLADSTFTSANVAAEIAYLNRPLAASFERPYGWAWLLSLHAELVLCGDRPWGSIVEPLALAFAHRFVDYLPKLIYPIRSGKHDCTAFALIHALRWADDRDPPLAELIRTSARRFYLDDIDARPWEPSGEDFLSATLCEAVLMSEVLGAQDFASWFASYLPEPFGDSAACLRTPVTVSDRTDGRLVHLDGLNLSRAWCWGHLAPMLPDHARAAQAASDHLAAALPHLADDFMGEHWLATFALLAFEARP